MEATSCAASLERPPSDVLQASWVPPLACLVTSPPSLFPLCAQRRPLCWGPERDKTLHHASWPAGSITRLHCLARPYFAVFFLKSRAKKTCYGVEAWPLLVCAI